MESCRPGIWLPLININFFFMRFIIIGLAAISILAFSSCYNKKHNQHQNENNEVPEALQEDKKSFSLSKRVPDDLVEELYSELEKENPVLQQLADKIEELQEKKKDSSEAFLDFDNKNNRYYADASHHNSLIQDSALKLRIQMLINNSLEQYANRAQLNKKFLQLLNNKNVTLNDLHEALKLIKTLPVIEKYQQTNLPVTNPLASTIHEYDETIQKADSLTKK